VFTGNLRIELYYIKQDIITQWNNKTNEIYSRIYNLDEIFFPLKSKSVFLSNTAKYFDVFER